MKKTPPCLTAATHANKKPIPLPLLSLLDTYGLLLSISIGSHGAHPLPPAQS